MVDSKLVGFVNDEIRRGRTKGEIANLLLGAGMTNEEVDSFWKEFLSSNSVPSGFDVVKPVVVQKSEVIDIPLKSGEVQKSVDVKTPVQPSQPAQPVVAPQTPSSPKGRKNVFLLAGAVAVVILVVLLVLFLLNPFKPSNASLSLNTTINSNSSPASNLNSSSHSSNSTSSSSSNSTFSNSKPSGVVDCNGSIDCFITQAQNCSSSKVDYLFSAPFSAFGTSNPNVTVNRLLLMGLNKTSSGCALYLNFESLNISFAQAYESQLLAGGSNASQQESLFAGLSGAGMVGTDGDCVFASTSSLLSVLNMYKQGVFNTSISNYNCSGFLFGQEQSLANYSLASSCSANVLISGGGPPFNAIVNASFASMPAGSELNYSCGQSGQSGSGAVVPYLLQVGSASQSSTYLAFNCSYAASGNYTLAFTNSTGFSCDLTLGVGG